MAGWEAGRDGTRRVFVSQEGMNNLAFWLHPHFTSYHVRCCHPESLRVCVVGDNLLQLIKASVVAMCEHNGSSEEERILI